MRKCGKLMLVGVLLVILISVATYSAFIKNKRNVFNGNYYCLVVETTQGENKTYFNYYDSDFKLLHQEKIPYSEFVSTNIDRMSVEDNKLYCAPVDGDWEGKNDLLTINLKNGELENRIHLPDELDLDKYVTVQDGEVYVNSNLNGDSYICRVDTDGNVAAYRKVKNETLDEMIVEGNRLYSFNYSEEGENPKLYIFDRRNLKTIDVIELNCSDGLHPFAWEGNIFFLASSVDNEQELIMGKYVVEENRVDYHNVDKSIEKAYSSLTQPILVNGELWFVALTTDGQSSLYRYALNTGKVKIIEMDAANIVQIAVDGTTMYALINDKSDNVENAYIQEFDVSSSEPVFKSQYSIATQKDNNKLYYAAGFFFNK